MSTFSHIFGLQLQSLLLIGPFLATLSKMHLHPPSHTYTHTHTSSLPISFPCFFPLGLTTVNTGFYKFLVLCSLLPRNVNYMTGWFFGSISICSTFFTALPLCLGHGRNTINIGWINEWLNGCSVTYDFHITEPYSFYVWKDLGMEKLRIPFLE